MTATLRMLLAHPTHGLQLVQVEPDYRVFNRLVGDGTQDGSISMCRLPEALKREGFLAYCDDDANARGQAPNPYATHLGHYNLRGPVLIFKDDGMGNELSLSPPEASWLLLYFHRPPSPRAVAEAEAERQFWADHPSGIAMYRLNDDLSRGEELEQNF